MPHSVQTDNPTANLELTLLDAMPMCLTCWDKSLHNIYCNTAAVKLFNLSNKEECLKRFRELSPGYQPCGSPSDVLAEYYMRQAFQEGYCRFEWMHRTLAGEDIPTEVTLVRTLCNGEYLLAGYTRDLRELKATKKKIREADERAQIMLDATPVCANFWDKNHNNIDCNLEAVKLFGLKNKQEYLNRFFELSPEFQPCGRRSSEMAVEKVNKAFQDGYCRFEWMHQKINGEPIPSEITLVRVKHRGGFIVVGYTRDLRELKAMLTEMLSVEADLRLARDSAEESTKAKSEFLANMSHEIRTPMNGILGLLHLVLNTELQPPQQNYLRKALNSANNLLRIIDDILDFSKIEAGKLEIENIPFAMQEVCDDLQNVFSAKIAEKGLQFHVNTESLPDTRIVGDPLRLKQVLFNLVSNALKFTDSGSVCVTIEKKMQEEMRVRYQFSVQDSGIGLTQEQLARLFSAFTQADASVTRKYGGTGLGLAISQNLVKMMHGEIWAESELGKGATFCFTATFDIAPPEENTPGTEAFSPMTEYWLPQEKEPDAQRQGSILLVEDNLINQLIAEELLKAVGYTVDIASNGEESLDKLAQAQYDLVLMDIQMPVMDGLTASRTIRENPAYSTLPIIAMSAHAMTGDKEKSLSHGMNEHITKPISPGVLYSTIDKWITAYRAQKA